MTLSLVAAVYAVSLTLWVCWSRLRNHCWHKFGAWLDNFYEVKTPSAGSPFAVFIYHDPTQTRRCSKCGLVEKRTL